MSQPQVMESPRSLSIAVTGRCNLRCAYCFYADEMTGLRDLDSSAWLAFFDTLGDLVVLSVTLTGGEPLSRPDFFELVDGIIRNRMRYSILSNGTLIDAGMIAAISEGKRRQRLDSIQVSIDGSCENIHDRTRPASFARAVRGLRRALSAGLPVTVRVTINKHNLNDLENIAEFLLEDVGVKSFRPTRRCQSARTVRTAATSRSAHSSRRRRWR